MKILHINASYKPAYIYGGPTMSVSMLCEHIAKAGVSVTVFTTTANGAAELPVTANQLVDVDGVNVIYFKRLTKDHSHLSPTLLIKLWKDAKIFQAIHIHAWWNLVSVFSCLIAVLRNMPVILSPRGMLSDYSFHTKNSKIKAVVHNLLGKPLLKRCHFHVTSSNEKDAVLQIIQPKSITVIPNFVKLSEQVLPPKNPDPATLKLIFFSRIQEKKGLDILFNALTMVSTPYHLTIAGTGKPEYIEVLKHLALKNNIADKISWVGFQNDNKFNLLYDHDLFILPSHDENFGNAVIESLSVGTPVLISEQVGLAEYVQKNNFGWICQTTPASVSGLIDKISRDHKDELKQIRQIAPARVYNDFGESELTHQYLDLYTKIIADE